MDVHKPWKESKEEQKGLARATPSVTRLRRATAILVLGTVLSGAPVSLGQSDKKDNTVQSEKSGTQADNSEWAFEYGAALTRALDNHAIKLLHTQQKKVDLIYDTLPEACIVLGSPNEFSFPPYKPRWVLAKVGRQIILYNIGEPMENEAKQKGRNNLDQFLIEYLQNTAMAARIIPIKHNESEVVVQLWHYGKKQEETKVNLTNGSIGKSIVFSDGRIFSALPPGLAPTKDGISVLKFDGKRFVKDKPYQLGIFGGDAGYYLDDRGDGIRVAPNRTVVECKNVDNPDSCKPKGYDVQFFNKDGSGNYGVPQAYLISGKKRDRIYPVREGKDDKYRATFEVAVPDYLRK